MVLAACGTIPENDPLRPSAAAGAGADAPGATASNAVSTPADDETPAQGTEQCDYEPTGDAAKSVRPPSPTGVETSGTVSYDLEMTEGTVRLHLDPVRAP